jgi:2-keto-4-pentenoate hydratase/2-oxohepta-3-ene-1,7-dioic acid hydratase in catechol pathway
VTLLPPLPNPDKIICIGRNYRGHVAEGGGQLPAVPSLFARLTNTLVAHGAPMIRPRISGDFDYEGELAFVIGKPGRHIRAADALGHIAGYSYATPCNTSAERHAAMHPWLHDHNTRQTHAALGGKPPVIRLKRDNLPE